MFMWIFGFIVIAIISVKVYQKFTLGICHCSAHMVGKTVIITGGDCGIGLATARDLADRGARVIIACITVQLATAAKKKILKSNPDAKIVCKQIDLSSLQSVKEFSEDIIRSENRLDVLINNAGVVGLGNNRTEDGLLIEMQVNYFGPFLLTCLLLPLLKSSAPSRIINVTSSIHKNGKVEFDNLNMEKIWNKYLVYPNSKLYLTIMTMELSRKLRGTGVTANCLHPGWAATNMGDNIFGKKLRKFLDKIMGFMVKTPWEAAQTSIYLAVSPEVKNHTGKYFSECREQKPSPWSQNLEIAKNLWTESEKLVKFTLTDDLVLGIMH